MSRLLRAVLAAALVGCGGKIDESNDGSANDGGVEAADPCIPIGTSFETAFEIAACDFAGSPQIALGATGYEAFYVADADVWSCTSATYSGCDVSYTNCSGSAVAWSGRQDCQIISTQLTFGSYGNGSVAHGMTSWSCTNPCGIYSSSGTNITFLYPLH